MEKLFDEPAPIAILIATNSEYEAFLRVAAEKASTVAEIQKADIKVTGAELETIESSLPFDRCHKLIVGRQRVIVLRTAETIRRAARAVDYISWCCGAKLIINFGTAGALKNEVKESDIYLAKRIVQSDFDISGGLTKREAKRLGQDYLVPGQHTGYDAPYIETNEELREWVRASYSQIKEVAVASSNKFVFGQEKADILEKFDADIVDMEAIGIELTAREEGIPTLILKCISDGVDSKAQDYYENATNVSEACSALVLDLIKQM